MIPFQPNAAALRDPLARDLPMPVSPFPTLGPWRLVRLIGEGEWNEVFQAAPLDATCASSADYAVKRIKPSLRNDPEAIAQLRLEAQLGRSIAHPHLVCVLSAHVERPPYYLVMPYQAGATVREHLKHRPWFSLLHGLWIARQAAEALDALSEAGYVHGDVKPENIVVAANGHVTLCDLGMAQRISTAPGDDIPLVGTPAYMPPECLISPTQISSASDTYRLGATLYEILAGRPPFPQANPAELAAAHRLLKPPDICGIRPEVPARVAHLLSRMLAKEPLRRPVRRELIEMLVDVEIDQFDDGPDE